MRTTFLKEGFFEIYYSVIYSIVSWQVARESNFFVALFLFLLFF